MTTTGKQRRPRGFSLLEVMVSGTILLIVISSTAGAFGLLDKAYQHQRYVTTAIHVCESTMESLLMLYPDNAKLAAGPHAGTSYDVRGRAGGTFFSTSWEVTPGTPIAGARRVEVTITWTEEGKSAPQQIKLRTVRL